MFSNACDFVSFSCGDSHPLRDVFSVQRPSCVPTDSAVADEKLKERSAEVSFMCSEQAGAQILQLQDSLSEYCSVSSDYSLEQQESLPGSSSEDRDLDKRTLQNQSETGQTQTQLQALTVIPVKGALWIPRCSLFPPNTSHFCMKLFISITKSSGGIKRLGLRDIRFKNKIRMWQFTARNTLRQF